jgi:hypothetical protein
VPVFARLMRMFYPRLSLFAVPLLFFLACLAFLAVQAVPDSLGAWAVQ